MATKKPLPSFEELPVGAWLTWRDRDMVIAQKSAEDGKVIRFIGLPHECPPGTMLHRIVFKGESDWQVKAQVYYHGREPGFWGYNIMKARLPKPEELVVVDTMSQPGKDIFTEEPTVRHTDTMANGLVRYRWD